MSLENRAQYQELEKKRREERNTRHRPNQQANRSRGRGGGVQRGNARGGGRGRGGTLQPYRRFQRNIVIYHPSIHVDDSYVILKRIPLSEISRVPSLASIPQGKDLRVIGSCGVYPVDFDQATTKKTQKLLPCTSSDEAGLSNPVTTLQDPNMRQLVMTYSPKAKLVVVISDVALAALMTSARSVHSWDLSIMIRSRFIFIDYREDRQSRVERTWVCETALEQEAITDVDPTAVGSASRLAEESQKANDAFRFAALRGHTTRIHPKGGLNAKETEHIAKSGIFRYRRFVLNEGTEDAYDVLVRSELDAALPKTKNKRNAKNNTGEGDKGDQFVRMFALLRHESANSPPWSALDESRGALMATESKLNACKFARWAVLGVVSNAQQIKIAFVQRDSSTERARESSTESAKHCIMGIETITPVDFATQIGFSLATGWAAFDFLIRHIFLGQLALKENVLEEGVTATLMRDSAKPEMTLFISPEELFDEDSDSDDQDE